MIPGVGVAILAFLTSATARVFAEKLIIWFAFKALITTLFIIVVPIVLNNLIAGMVEDSLTYLDGITGVASFGGTATFTGVMGFLADCFCLSEVLSIMIGALQLHLVFKMIPFSPFK